MTFDFRIITIGYGEPTLWVAVALCGLVAVILGRWVGVWIGRMQDRWRRHVYGGVFTVAIAIPLILLPHVLLYALFSETTEGAMVCPVFVGPALLIPMFLGMGAEAIAWRQTRAQRAA
jgi:ABC-type dipeptide/oligopeptide/nickel transport system permease component